MFGELEALERLASAVGLFGVFVIFGMVSLAFYVRSWGKRHVSEGKAEESDTSAHLAIAEAVRAALSEVMSQSVTKDTRIDTLQTRVFELSDSVTRLTVENAEARARYEAETVAAANVQAILLDRLDKVEIARSQERRELENKLDQLNRANGELRAQMLTMADRQSKLEDELEKYRAQHERSERENGQLKQTVDKLEHERAALQVCVNDQQRQITELEGEVARLKTELRAYYEAEAVLVENADGDMVVKKRDTGKLTPQPEEAAD